MISTSPVDLMMLSSPRVPVCLFIVVWCTSPVDRFFRKPSTYQGGLEMCTPNTNVLIVDNIFVDRDGGPVEIHLNLRFKKYDIPRPHTSAV